MNHLPRNKGSEAGYTHFDPENQFQSEVINDALTVTGLSDLTEELLSRKFGKKKNEKLSVTAWSEDAAFFD